MKNFGIQIVVRTLLLVLTIFIASYFYLTSTYIISVAVLIAVAAQVYILIKYLQTTNRELERFLQGINYSDFSQHTNIEQYGKSFKALSEEMNKVLSNFKNARFEKEESIRYLQTVVEHVNIGLVSFNAKGDVELINKSAKKILKVAHLKSVLALDKYYDGFGHFLFQLQSEKKSTFKLIENGEEIQLMIYGTEFRMKDQNLKLISLYNIQPELEEKEIESWQKLIRVLTHEIMNSITPISSLASTANSIIKNLPEQTNNQEQLSDVGEALNTIQRRSEGLTSFVNKFRDISKIPKPNFQSIKVTELFYRIRLLAEQIIADKNIELTISINPENLELFADPGLLEQVLINLIKNSVQALAETASGQIKLTAEINDRGRALLKVIDNGPGITSEVMDRIFVPFFSTKKDGSGIGLSISQSIIRAHNGNIWVQSKPDIGTTFAIRL
jgi:nitrogen fixation/metabolism regulation signal transduction histidine kinase